MEEQSFGPIRFIPGQNTGKYPFCHSLYIEDAGVLIDPGSDRGRLIHLKNAGAIKAVWLTHWHEDHIMHLDVFDDVPLWISEQDSPPLSNIEVFLDWYGFKKGATREYWRSVFAEQFHFKPRKPFDVLRGGHKLRLGSTTVEIISTPGHTPGHLAFFFKELALLFMGDYDLTKFGPWYGDVHSSIENTVSSVESLRRIPANVWLTGHETGVFRENPGDLWDQYLGVIQERENKLLSFLDKPATMDEIVQAWIVYGRPREPRIAFASWERAMINKHLEYLLARSTIEFKNERFVRTDK